MKENALVSVIVPVYKVEAYLDQAVESLVNQTYTNIEIILIDDGSPDNCGAMCDAWAKKDSRVRVIHRENAGVAATRNVGLEASRGEYLVFVDSDDYVEPTCVEKLYYAVTNSQADMAVCGMTYLKRNGDCTDVEVTAQDRVVDGKAAMLLLESAGNAREAYTAMCNKIYRRGLWDEIRFPVGKVYEDSFVLPEVFYLCKTVVLLKSCLYIYRKREGSITAQEKEKYATVYLEMMEWREQFYEKVGMKELLMLHHIHMYGTYEYLQMQTKATRRCVQKKIRKCYLMKHYTTKIPFSRRVKNLVAVVSLPLYHRLVDMLQ